MDAGDNAVSVQVSRSESMCGRVRLGGEGHSGDLCAFC